MLVKVTRPYGGQEGRRVKPGVLFSVDKQVEGIRTITSARWNQLRGMKLARELAPGEDGAPAAPNARPPRSRPGPTPDNKMEPGSPTRQREPAQRSSARRRSQEESPKEPRPLARRGGSQAGGQEQPASLSPEVRQVGSLTFKQRGTRRGSAGSPSTTPDSPPPTPPEPTSPQDSAHGLMSSTPATADGGTGSGPVPDSAAFD